MNTYEHLPTGRTLTVNPMQCFSACSKANSVAFDAPGKYSYHFASLDAPLPESSIFQNGSNLKNNGTGSDSVIDLVKFAGHYVNDSGDAWSKAGDRPPACGKAHTLSRMPPLPQRFLKPQTSSSTAATVPTCCGNSCSLR